MSETPPLPRHERRARETEYDDVTISPRYLAGGAMDVQDAFFPLTHHYWHEMHDELGNCYVTTHDSQLRVAFLPELSELIPDSTALWQIRARRDIGEPPVWSAAFTDGTPPEVIAGFTAALDADVTAGGYGRHPYMERDDHPETVWNLLRDAHWEVHVEGFDIEALSPDGLARLAYRTPGAGVPRSEAWLATVHATPQARRTLWEADFHAATPAHLLSAFATALADPTPVTREHDLVPAPCRDRARPLHPPAERVEHRPGPTPLDVRRAQAARSRTTPPVPTSTVRWTSPSTPPTTPSTGPRARR